MKKIALIDNEMFTMKNKMFPNLALMKISTFYKEKGYEVEWFDLAEQHNYESIFLSKIFTYTEVAPIVKHIDKNKLISGGTGIDESTKLLYEIEQCKADYSIYNVDYAIGFLTRGCNNACNWCIVPRKEGNVHLANSINDIVRTDTQKVLLLDNNILQYEYHLDVLNDIIDSNFKIDFNQGMDIRRINNDNAKLLSRIKWIKYIRFSCDSVSQVEYFAKNLKILMNYGIAESRFFIYLLVKDISDAEKRVQFFRENFNKVTIYAQAYRDFENKVIITKEQKEFCQRYIYSGKWRKTKWNDYNANYGR